jgi:hypothetical protein
MGKKSCINSPMAEHCASMHHSSLPQQNQLKHRKQQHLPLHLPLHLQKNR